MLYTLFSLMCSSKYSLLGFLLRYSYFTPNQGENKPRPPSTLRVTVFYRPIICLVLLLPNSKLPSGAMDSAYDSEGRGFISLPRFCSLKLDSVILFFWQGYLCSGFDIQRLMFAGLGFVFPQKCWPTSYVEKQEYKRASPVQRKCKHKCTYNKPPMLDLYRPLSIGFILPNMTIRLYFRFTKVGCNN